jgi:outer membrane protein assembly factor BamA
LAGIGCRLNRDKRPNRFYPTRGTFLDFNSTFFGESLGSKYSFRSCRATFNAYRSIGVKQVLAYNLFACATGGQPPFYAECIYGTNNQLRGYVAGQHIDRYMIGTQAEYRLTLLWRFGAVVFGGLGGLAPASPISDTEIFSRQAAGEFASS